MDCPPKKSCHWGEAAVTGGSTALIHNPLAFELADYWPRSSLITQSKAHPAFQAVDLGCDVF